jgi:protocatechuate 3,4-dioxygenase beta subunit
MLKRTKSGSVLSRRSGIAIAAGTLMSSLVAKGATPAQTEGPFHPLNRDTDLSNGGRADGISVTIQGIVKDDSTGAPLSRVLVELWQADANGLYNHPADDRQGTRDEDFQFWGRTVTDDQGRFSFRTVKPGPYPANTDGSWMRPPHLHWRFSRNGYQAVTTQTYFSDEVQLNRADRILQALTAADQAKVVLNFAGTSRTGQFIVELAKATR